MSSYTTQFEYLDHLKRALAGLPEQLVANTLADYQQRYIDGLSAGRSEAEIADEMDDPRVVAARVAKAAVPAAGVLETPPAASGVARVFFAGLGLAVFNFFMFLPAMVYLVLLIALPVVSGVTYTVGIAVTASSLAGVNELVLDGPFRHVVMHKKAGADQAGFRQRLQPVVVGGGVTAFVLAVG